MSKDIPGWIWWSAAGGEVMLSIFTEYLLYEAGEEMVL